MIVGKVLVQPRRAVRPGQWRFEAVQQIDQTPGNNGVVVQSHYIANHRRGDPDAAQVRRHLAPNADGSLSQSLANGQFQVEDRYALDAQHYEVGHQEGSSAVLLGQVGETPYIAQANGIAVGWELLSVTGITKKPRIQDSKNKIPQTVRKITTTEKENV